MTRDFITNQLRTVTIILNAITLNNAISKSEKDLHLQGLLPMTGTGWNAGGACVPAVLMAMRDVNKEQGLLVGYNLTYSWVDSQVKFWTV